MNDKTDVPDQTTLLEDIINNLPNMIFVKEACELRFVMINPAGEKLLGVNKDDLIGKNDYDLFPAEQANFFQKKDRLVLENKELVVIREEPVETPAGTKWLRTRKVPILDEKGNPTYLLGISEEITELKKSRDELNQQKNFLKDTVDNLPAIFYAKDLEGRFLYANHNFEKLFNLKRAEIINKNNHELFSEMIANQFRENDLKIIDGKKVIESEEFAQSADGDLKVYHSIKFPYFDENNEVVGTGGISIDITDKKVLERQANHHAKLASIGQLSAGIGHEINNPLAIITGYLMKIKQSLKSHKEVDSVLLEDISKIEKASIRIEHIVKGLRSFSRADDESWEVFDFLNLTEESVLLLKEIYLQEGVVLDYFFETSNVMINGNRGRIQQVLINLISNAKDATKDNQSDRKIHLKSWTDDLYVYLSVADNGKGMDKKVQEKIFDPFFTTKEVNEGTGIGLSLVHNIVQDHEGHVSVESEPKMGSVFTLKLLKYRN